MDRGGAGWGAASVAGASDVPGWGQDDAVRYAAWSGARGNGGRRGGGGDYDEDGGGGGDDNDEGGGAGARGMGSCARSVSIGGFSGADGAWGIGSEAGDGLFGGGRDTPSDHEGARGKRSRKKQPVARGRGRGGGRGRGRGSTGARGRGAKGAKRKRGADNDDDDDDDYDAGGAPAPASRQTKRAKGGTGRHRGDGGDGDAARGDEESTAGKVGPRGPGDPLYEWTQEQAGFRELLERIRLRTQNAAPAPPPATAEERAAVQPPERLGRAGSLARRRRCPLCDMGPMGDWSPVMASLCDEFVRRVSMMRRRDACEDFARRIETAIVEPQRMQRRAIAQRAALYERIKVRDEKRLLELRTGAAPAPAPPQRQQLDCYVPRQAADGDGDGDGGAGALVGEDITADVIEEHFFEPHGEASIFEIKTHMEWFREKFECLKAKVDADGDDINLKALSAAMKASQFIMSYLKRTAQTKENILGPGAEAVFMIDQPNSAVAYVSAYAQSGSGVLAWRGAASRSARGGSLAQQIGGGGAEAVARQKRRTKDSLNAGVPSADLSIARIAGSGMGRTVDDYYL